MTDRHPRALYLIGGLDPTGGAGISRDVWVARSLAPEFAVHAVASMWTWQGRGQTARGQEIPLSRFRELLQVLGPGVLKVGAIGAQACGELCRQLEQLAHPPRIVLDPVIRASDGGALTGFGPEHELLAARAALVTPNLGEALAILGCGPAGPRELLAALALRWPDTAILLKGGHIDPTEPTVVDFLRVGDQQNEFSRPRHAGRDPRGTGCALATAIACARLSDRSLGDAVAVATKWLDRERRRAVRVRGDQWHLCASADRPGFAGQA